MQSKKFREKIDDNNRGFHQVFLGFSKIFFVALLK